MRELPFKVIFITDETKPFDFTCLCIKRITESRETCALIHRNNLISAREYFEEAQTFGDMIRGTNVFHFTSRRLDIAVALETHLHLPENAISPNEARHHFPASRLVSSSIHTAAPDISSDLVLLAPVFHPISKPNDTRLPLGVDEFNRIAKQQPQPTFALGGMSREKLHRLAEAAGYAVSISAFDRLELALGS